MTSSATLGAMSLTMSCAFATSLQTPDHVAEAERLGYARAWLYDSPALYPDVWAMLALAASRTTTIGLGPGVLIPSLRHPMANAAGIAMLETMAPGRVAVAIGSGFTGRLTLGQKPLRWSYVREYVSCVQALLAGETVMWEGGKIRMMQPAGFGAPRPLKVPMILGTGGPKGEEVARELADGIFATSPSAAFDWCAVLATGTVLDDGEAPDSPRAVAAAGHAAGLMYHALHLRGAAANLPNGAAWVAELEEFPADEQHLYLHEGHLVVANERDLRALTPDIMARVARTSEGWRAHLRQLEERGATEVAYQPAGPDIAGELARFAELARSI